MKIAFFSTKPYDRAFFDQSNSRFSFSIDYHEARLTPATAGLAKGAEAVCVFVNDTVDRKVLEQLSGLGVRWIALRCAGFNNVDLDAVRDLHLKVVRVPAYSPHAVAEHTVALLQTLNR